MRLLLNLQELSLHDPAMFGLLHITFNVDNRLYDDVDQTSYEWCVDNKCIT